MRERRQNGTSGQTMAYMAAFLAFVVVPLMVLSVDIVRAFYVRTHLQAAADAACEAAAQALDVPYFRAAGQGRINLALGAVWGQREFSAAVEDRGLRRYNPALGGMRLLSPTVAACTASASLDLLIPASPPLTVRVSSVSEMRTGRN